MSNKEIFRSVTLSPAESLAGDSHEFVLELVIGADYSPGAGRIVVDYPGTLGMSRPSLLHSEDHGFVEVYVSNPNVSWLKRNWDMEINDFASRDKSGWRGMAQRLTFVDLSAGLVAGDVVKVVWGDTCRGFGPGAKVTTVVPHPEYEAELFVRYFDTPHVGAPDLGRDLPGIPRPVPTHVERLSFRVRPREPHHVRLIRKPDKAMLLVHDAHWNVVEDVDASDVVDAGGEPTRNDFGVLEYADKDIKVHTKGLPLWASAPMDDVFDGRNIYWGDLHSHSAFSNDCITRERLQMPPEKLIPFARDRACLDFYAVTDHHEPHHDVTNRIRPDHWARTCEAVAANDRPGSFLAFAGFEYRCPRGDTAVVLNEKLSYDEIDRPEWTDIRKLWDGLRGRDYLTIPHFHNPGRGLAAGWWRGPEEVEPILEIHSCHGSYENESKQESPRPMMKGFRYDRNGAWMLANGFRYGLGANGDDHKGHVGASGITAVYARELTASSILAAYRARNVYGTSNARIRLLFTGNGRLMGSVLAGAADKEFGVHVVGTAPVKKVDLFRNGVHWRMFPGDGAEFRRDIAVRDEGPSSWYIRATQVDNQVAWSSPIWFE